MGHTSAMDLAQRDASPNKLRIKQLSEKLGFLQDEMDHEKQARSDATELKLKVLDDKLLRAQITEEEKLSPLNEKIERLMEELAAERLSREVMDERKTKEIKSVESSISRPHRREAGPQGPRRQDYEAGGRDCLRPAAGPCSREEAARGGRGAAREGGRR